MTTLTPHRRRDIALAATSLRDALRIRHVGPAVWDRLAVLHDFAEDYALTGAGQSLDRAVRAADDLRALLPLFGSLTFTERWLVCQGLRVGDTVRGDG